MVLKLYKYGEQILRTKATPVHVVTATQRKLAEDMVETMHKARGVGLAAEQVGRTEQLCVIDVPADCDTEEDAAFNASVPMPLLLWNPQIISSNGSVNDKEGCLSFPGIGGSIVRAEQVTVQYLDVNNHAQIITARGYLARALQHEIDHLNGVLYIDHMTAVERLTFVTKLQKLAKANGGTR